MLPAVVQVYDAGALADQPLAVAKGLVDDSLTMYPVTNTLSVAVRLLTATVSEVAVAGTVKVFTVGAVVSVSVIVTLALLLADTLPAASLAQA